MPIPTPILDVPDDIIQRRIVVASRYLLKRLDHENGVSGNLGQLHKDYSLLAS